MLIFERAIAMSLNSFFSGVKFYDDDNFPYQFSRSGDFSLDEAELLTNCGFIMQQLHNRIMRPENEEQAHFVDVLESKTTPLYRHEQVYLKYLKLIEKKKTAISSVRKVKNTESSYTDYQIEDI